MLRQATVAPGLDIGGQGSGGAMNLSGNAAIVTGAGTGVGRATALALAEAGCSVAVNYSRSREAAEEVAALAARHGVQAIAVQADVAVDADCRQLVETQSTRSDDSTSWSTTPAPRASSRTTTWRRSPLRPGTRSWA